MVTQIVAQQVTGMQHLRSLMISMTIQLTLANGTLMAHGQSQVVLFHFQLQAAEVVRCVLVYGQTINGI